MKITVKQISNFPINVHRNKRLFRLNSSSYEISNSFKLGTKLNYQHGFTNFCSPLQKKKSFVKVSVKKWRRNNRKRRWKRHSKKWRFSPTKRLFVRYNAKLKLISNLRTESTTPYPVNSKTVRGVNFLFQAQNKKSKKRYMQRGRRGKIFLPRRKFRFKRIFNKWHRRRKKFRVRRKRRLLLTSLNQRPTLQLNGRNRGHTYSWWALQRRQTAIFKFQHFRTQITRVTSFRSLNFFQNQIIHYFYFSKNTWTPSRINSPKSSTKLNLMSYPKLLTNKYSRFSHDSVTGKLLTPQSPNNFAWIHHTKVVGYGEKALGLVGYTKTYGLENRYAFTYVKSKKYKFPYNAKYMLTTYLSHNFNYLTTWAALFDVMNWYRGVTNVCKLVKPAKHRLSLWGDNFSDKILPSPALHSLVTLKLTRWKTSFPSRNVNLTDRKIAQTPQHLNKKYLLKAKLSHFPLNVFYTSRRIKLKKVKTGRPWLYTRVKKLRKKSLKFLNLPLTKSYQTKTGVSSRQFLVRRLVAKPWRTKKWLRYGKKLRKRLRLRRRRRKPIKYKKFNIRVDSLFPTKFFWKNRWKTFFWRHFRWRKRKLTRRVKNFKWKLRRRKTKHRRLRKRKALKIKRKKTKYLSRGSFMKFSDESFSLQYLKRRTVLEAINGETKRFNLRNFHNRFLASIDHSNQNFKQKIRLQGLKLGFSINKHLFEVKAQSTLRWVEIFQKATSLVDNLFLSPQLLKYELYKLRTPLLYNTFRAYNTSSLKLHTNILPSLDIKSSLNNKMFTLTYEDIYQKPVAIWYNNLLIRFLENIYGTAVLFQFFPFLEKIVAEKHAIQYRFWMRKMNYYERRLGHKFFLQEGVHLIHISFCEKDALLLFTWLKTIIQRISFWKTRFIFRFIKYIFLNHMQFYFPNIKAKGFKVKLKGKISVAGNSRKRTILFRAGKTSYTSVALKVIHHKGTIVTFTGVMGFQIWIFY